MLSPAKAVFYSSFHKGGGQRPEDLLNMFKLPTIESKVVALKILAIVVSIQLFPTPIVYGDLNPATPYTKAFETVINTTSLVAETPFVKNTRRTPVTVTAYTATAQETDSTPCITASGLDICAHPDKNVVAANFLPFGTKVKIPELFGNRVFSVEDRMHARYNSEHRVDVLVRSRAEARTLGINRDVGLVIYQ